jgi:virulence-associated protein VagC
MTTSRPRRVSPAHQSSISGSATPDSATDRVRAKLFQNGRSQAVRLPKAFRFSGSEVFIRREGDVVMLEPVPQSQWPAGYWELIDEKRDDLALGRVPPLGAHLADVDEQDI